MKNIYEVLRLKEGQIARLEIEVEALRVAAPLLSDDNEAGNENKPTSARSTALSQAIEVPLAVNASPQPARAAHWEHKAQRW